MKTFLFVTAIVLLAMGRLYSPAQADGIINWAGNGSENLPCEYGGHWVLAPSEGITGAILHVNGSDYTMIQHGNGSWSADSSGPLDSDLTASVSYTGEGDSRNHLQLSHCAEGADPTPTETDVPPTPTETTIPTETSAPTETPDPTETLVPTETSVPTSTPTVPVDPTLTSTPETPTSTTPPPDPTLTATPIPTLPVPPVSTPELLPITGADLSSGGPTPLGSVIFTIGGILLVIVGLALKFKQ